MAWLLTRMMTRLVVVRVCLLLPLVIGAGGARTSIGGGWDAVADLFGVAAGSVALLGPPILGVVWGAFNQADAPVTCALAHVSSGRLRGALLLAGLALVGAVATLALLAGGASLLLAPGDRVAPSTSATDRATTGGVALVATLLVVTVWVPAVVMSMQRRAAAMVSMLLALLYVLSRLTPSDGPLGVLRSLVPISAIEVIDDGREGVPSGLGLLAVAALALWLAWAAFVLTGLPETARSSRRGSVAPRSRVLASVVWVTSAVLAGAMLPTAFVTGLPSELRPSCWSPASTTPRRTRSRAGTSRHCGPATAPWSVRPPSDSPWPHGEEEPISSDSDPRGPRSSW